MASFTYTADAIKRHGAVPSVELSHSGQYAGTYLLDKNKKESMTQYGPSRGHKTGRASGDAPYKRADSGYRTGIL